MKKVSAQCSLLSVRRINGRLKKIFFTLSALGKEHASGRQNLNSISIATTVSTDAPTLSHLSTSQKTDVVGSLSLEVD